MATAETVEKNNADYAPRKDLDRFIEIVRETDGWEKPVVAGHRISVFDIVIWHEWMGESVNEIASEYHLTPAEVHAALAYYYDNKEEVDAAIDQRVAFAEAMRKKTPSVLAERLAALLNGPEILRR